MTLREQFEADCQRYDRFLNNVIAKIQTVAKVFDSDRDVNQRIERITHEAFGSGLWTENDYLHTLYGAIAPNAAFLDFKHHIDCTVKEIHDYFEYHKY